MCASLKLSDAAQGSSHSAMSIAALPTVLVQCSNIPVERYPAAHDKEQADAVMAARVVSQKVVTYPGHTSARQALQLQ
eukprot:4894643-Amphidinium_carterae.1